MRTWKKYYHPFSVGEFLIVPAWEKVPVTEKKVVRMDPGMAVGSGTHESTMLCLKALQEITPRGFVYDVGCGSGILGLAALLSGAQRGIGRGFHVLSGHQCLNHLNRFN